MKFFAAITSLFLLAACASNEPTYSTDYDLKLNFERFKTYRWYGDVNPSKEEEFRSKNDSYKRIRKAIDEYLFSRGFREAKQNRPDFLVNYSVSTQDHVKIDQFARYPEGGMHGAVSTGTYGSGVAIGWSSKNSGVRTYKEGTAVIDIVDAANNRLIWRGIAEGRMSKKVDFSQRRQTTREVVEALLGQFPPQKK
jgi:hypothetical protein